MPDSGSSADDVVTTPETGQLLASQGFMASWQVGAGRRSRRSRRSRRVAALDPRQGRRTPSSVPNADFCSCVSICISKLKKRLRPVDLAL